MYRDEDGYFPHKYHDFYRDKSASQMFYWLVLILQSKPSHFEREHCHRHFREPTNNFLLSYLRDTKGNSYHTLSDFLAGFSCSALCKSYHKISNWKPVLQRLPFQRHPVLETDS